MIYRRDHIPKETACNRRPGYGMAPTSITIHNTGNPLSSAANERGWLTNPANPRQASFHIVVDEREAIECIPLSENAWHAGDGSGSMSGNRTSIGVEICESGNYAKTLENAVKLVAGLLRERGWGVDRLRRHWDWSKKICPRLMYDDGKWTGWTDFKNRVNVELKGAVNVKQDSEKVNVIVNGKKIKDGKLVDGVTYVPLRAISEAFGAKVEWDNKTKTAAITK
ncbi:N-acetylmuramoyl-L-alanine amidase [Paenibacillus sp. NPDC093718]|uniref:N-acetylmuramoyl-L-alanine amidase n=1 Tax=Paenibacillus sp. NPDC093718 TaxID=3390601 RepID=UPI003CFE13B1